MAKKRGLQWLITAPDSLNLAEELDAEELGRLGSDVVQTYELDLNDRADWSLLSESALKLAKLVKEPKTSPWEGCANIKHPLITSATIQFAARAYPEVCKGNKIVKCQITGDNPKNIPAAPATQTPISLGMAGPTAPSGAAPPEMGAGPSEMMAGPPEILNAAPPPQGMAPPTGPGIGAAGTFPPGLAMQGQPPQQTGPSPEEQAKNAKQDRADRISLHMNWQLTQEMVEWEEQMDRLLHVLPVIGQCYKKTYFSSIDNRNVSELVLPDDCVVNAGAKSIKTARRITHRIWIYANEVWEKVNSGVWLEVNLGTTGDKPEDIDAPHEFLEQHAYADLDGDDYKEPYIVTVHKQTGQVVRVVARWQPDAVMPSDKKMKVGKIVPDEYFTHFGFIPNPDGSLNYLGFGQLLEPLNASVNTALNQLLDAGSLYNSGGGFIGRGVRMKGGSTNFKLGEWKFIDAPGTNIRDNLVPLPVREPSQTLFQLLGFLVQAGKEISSVQDILTGDANLAASMPVGTAMAMVEQGLKVFTAIYKRVYRSLSEEFKKLYNLNARYLEPDFTFYITGREDQYQVGQRDYLTGDTTVVPVADPDLSSDMQRLLKAQALKDLSGRPGLNEVEVTRRLVRAVRPEDMDTVLMTDNQISGKEPMSWSPPPQPQMVVAQAKAEHLKARAQEAIVRLQMDMSKHSLEIESLLADIGKKKADAILSLAKAEAAEAGPQLQQYQAELNMITSQAKMQTDVMKEKIKAMAGQAGMAGQPAQAGQPALPEPEPGETPQQPEEMPIQARAAGGPVNPNQPYLVGEQGPEVIVPNQTGTVIPNDTFTQALQQYPILQKLGVAGVHTNIPGKYGDIESWQPGEPGTTGYERPKEIPLDRFGVQIFGGGKTKPIDVLADVASHHMIDADPQIKQYYQQFNDSLTPDQRGKLERDYQYSKDNEGETRPIDEWAKASRIPAYFRGYTFNQWPDEFNKQFYTPEQVQILDNVRGYLGVKPPNRQMGGPVEAGQPYLVGEQGPEVVVPTQPATVFPNPDPFGSEYYDTASAQNYGLKPDQTGHWPSRVPQGPQVGLILKSEQHPTFWKTMAEDKDAGYQFYRNVHDGRVYSFPGNETVPPDYYPYEDVQ